MSDAAPLTAFLADQPKPACAEEGCNQPSSRTDRCCNHASMSIGGAVVRVDRRLLAAAVVCGHSNLTQQTSSDLLCGGVIDRLSSANYGHSALLPLAAIDRFLSNNGGRYQPRPGLERPTGDADHRIFPSVRSRYRVMT